MRLISLELQGFKSFPDKTLLKFAPGVTTVVGPNGSGKSNISDAVRWVLGERSSKTLRGTKMEDVIFNGTDKRKPMSYAEVSITIDNREEDGFSRLKSEYDEVTITRRFNRNGSSDYFINRKSAKLSDINSLFMNTGIGRDGYSIISQGKAAEIISQKSDERRNVFEEAAGISRYRYQKNDAEKTLAETALNCERLADILHEKKLALGRLEKDAERAIRYNDVIVKKREADLGLTVYDVRTLREKSSEKQQKYEIQKRAVEIADREISDMNAEYENLDIEKNRAKAKFMSLSSEISEITKSRYDEESDAKVLVNDIEHVTESISLSKEKAESYRSELSGYESEAAKAADTLSEISGKHKEAEAERDVIVSESDLIQKEIDALDLEIEASLTKTDETESHQDKLRMRFAELEGSATSTEDRRSALKAEYAEIEKNTVTCKEGLEKYKKRIDDYQQRADKLNAQAEECTRKVEVLRIEEDKLGDKAAELLSEVRVIRSQIDTLRRMEETFEGYPRAVSILMNAQRSGNIRGMLGPLSHVFSVKQQYSLAIETALGGNLQNMVCESDESAKAAVRWLKENRAGRATFYPLNTMQVYDLPVSMSDVSKHKGYIGVASDLTEYEPKFEKVIKNLLGRTLIFDNMDNANAAAKSYGYRIKIVTTDGQVINSGGSLTGGSEKRESGTLNRTANIEKLEAERIKKEAEMKLNEEELAKIRSEIEKLSGSGVENNGTLKLLNTLISQDMSHYTAFETQYRSDTERMDKIKEQLSGIALAEQNAEKEKADIRNEISRLDSVLSELEKHRNEKVSVKQETRKRLSDKNDEYNDIMVTITALSKDVLAAQLELERKVSGKNECEENLKKTENYINSSVEKLAELKAKLASAATATKQFDDDLEKLTKERDEQDRYSTELEVRLGLLKKQVDEKTATRSAVSIEYTKLETQLENINSDLDRLINYLQTEYNLTFSEAEAQPMINVGADNRAEIAQEVSELKNKLKGIGNVDPNSVEEYNEAKKVYEDMTAQFEDLTKSRADYEKTIDTLEKEMKTRFVTVMNEINLAFQRVFRELFGGGNAELLLEDPDDVLHCGIIIKVAPPGKIIRNLSQLSGGEQAFISIALFFAILQVNPSPFCIFDEVEAALDEVNVAMYANYLKKYCDKTQFITITHRRGTMEIGDTLYGVTMAERGISRVLTLNVNEVESKLGVKL